MINQNTPDIAYNTGLVRPCILLRLFLKGTFTQPLKGSFYMDLSLGSCSGAKQLPAGAEASLIKAASLKHTPGVCMNPRVFIWAPISFRINLPN